VRRSPWRRSMMTLTFGLSAADEPLVRVFTEPGGTTQQYHGGLPKDCAPVAWPSGARSRATAGAHLGAPGGARAVAEPNGGEVDGPDRRLAPVRPF
jgi:hypothetical protein